MILTHSTIILAASTTGRTHHSHTFTDNSATATKITWTKAANAKLYNLRIQKKDGSAYKAYEDVWGMTDTSYSVILPTGDYSVYVDACNSTKYVASNTVTFTVKQGVCSHSYKDMPVQATLTKDGKIEKKCSACGNVRPTTTKIYRPARFTLSTTEYTYSGGTKTPLVTVKDSTGKTLKKDTDYSVSYSSGRKNVGKYTAKITFKGKYSGTKLLYFTINPVKTLLTSLKNEKK